MSHFQPRTQLFLAVPPTTCAAQSSSGPLPTWATRATAASLSIQILPRHLEWFNTQQETASGPKIDTIVSVVQTEILPVFRSPLPNDPKRPRPKMILTSALLSDRDEPEPHDMFLEYEIKDVKGRGRANGLEVIIEIEVKAWPETEGVIEDYEVKEAGGVITINDESENSTANTKTTNATTTN